MSTVTIFAKDGARITTVDNVTRIVDGQDSLSTLTLLDAHDRVLAKFNPIPSYVVDNPLAPADIVWPSIIDKQIDTVIESYQGDTPSENQRVVLLHDGRLALVSAMIGDDGELLDEYVMTAAVNRRDLGILMAAQERLSFRETDNCFFKGRAFLHPTLPHNQR